MRSVPVEAAGSAQLSVVIPSRNRRRTLGALVDCVLADPVVAEVIVVDDQSGDGTGAYLDARAPA